MLISQRSKILSSKESNQIPQSKTHVKYAWITLKLLFLLSVILFRRIWGVQKAIENKGQEQRVNFLLFEKQYRQNILSITLVFLRKSKGIFRKQMKMRTKIRIKRTETDICSNMISQFILIAYLLNYRFFLCKNCNSLNIPVRL